MREPLRRLHSTIVSASSHQSRVDRKQRIDNSSSVRGLGLWVLGLWIGDGKGLRRTFSDSGGWVSKPSGLGLTFPSFLFEGTSTGIGRLKKSMLEGRFTAFVRGAF